MFDYCAHPANLHDKLMDIIVAHQKLVTEFNAAHERNELIYFMNWHGHDLYELTVHAEYARQLTVMLTDRELSNNVWFEQIKSIALREVRTEMRIASQGSLQSANLVDLCKRSFWINMLRATTKEYKDDSVS